MNITQISSTLLPKLTTIANAFGVHSENASNTICMYGAMCVCMYVNIYVCMYVHIYVCMYVCMYVCI